MCPLHSSVNSKNKSLLLFRVGGKSSAADTPALFLQAFEYIPSRYDLADELSSKARVESEAKRMAVSETMFVGCC